MVPEPESDLMKGYATGGWSGSESLSDSRMLRASVPGLGGDGDLLNLNIGGVEGGRVSDCIGFGTLGPGSTMGPGRGEEFS